MAKKIYYDYDKGILLTASGGRLTNDISIAYQDFAEWELHVMRLNSSGVYENLDLSEALAWDASIDKDFTHSTTPMIRSGDDLIDDTDKSAGVLLVKLNADTNTFAAAVDGSQYKTAYFEAKGYNNSAQRVFYIQFALRAYNIIDPNSGTSIDPESEYYTAAQTDALLRAGRSFQFSLDGISWHDTQASADIYYRERYPDGDWSIAIMLKAGPAGETGAPGADGADGTDAPALQIQYSADGSGSWHTPATGSDYYMRTSTDGGSTWSAALKFRGEDGSGAVDSVNGHTGAVTGLAELSGSSDISITDASKGLVLVDRVTASNYRFYIENGIIGVETV